MVLISGTMLLVVGITTFVTGMLGGGLGTLYVTQKAANQSPKETRVVASDKFINDILDKANFSTLVGATKNLTEAVDGFRATQTTTAPPVILPGFMEVPQNIVLSPRKIVRPVYMQQRGPRRVRRSSPWPASAASGSKDLTVLTDDASVDLDTTNITQYKTRVLESGVIAPQLGLVMEQTGSYMEYSGYILYVPIIYHMPHLAAGSLIGKGIDCNVTANAQHQEMIINLLKEKIVTLIPHHHTLRKKTVH